MSGGSRSGFQDSGGGGGGDNGVGGRGGVRFGGGSGFGGNNSGFGGNSSGFGSGIGSGGFGGGGVGRNGNGVGQGRGQNGFGATNWASVVRGGDDGNVFQSDRKSGRGGSRGRGRGGGRKTGGRSGWGGVSQGRGGSGSKEEKFKSDEILIQHIPEELFTKEDLKSHFEYIVPNAVKDVSLRGGKKNFAGEVKRTAKITFDTQSEAEEAMEHGRNYKSIMLDMKYFIPQEKRVEYQEKKKAAGDSWKVSKAPPKTSNTFPSGTNSFVLPPSSAPFGTASQDTRGEVNPFASNLQPMNNNNMASMSASKWSQPLDLSGSGIGNQTPKIGLFKTKKKEMKRSPSRASLFVNADKGENRLNTSAFNKEASAPISNPFAAPSTPFSASTKQPNVFQSRGEDRRPVIRRKSDSGKEQKGNASTSFWPQPSSFKEKRKLRFALSEKTKGAESSARQGVKLSEAKSNARKNASWSHKMNLADAVAVQGTCQSMCPPKEIIIREKGRDLSWFERDHNSAEYKADPRRTIKKYRRSAASAETPRPEEIRPPQVLAKTMDYMLDHVIDTPESVQPAIAVHNFIRDRTRGIRQDFTFQGIRDFRCIFIMEEIARFHIASAHKLCHLTHEFSAQQNFEQLDKCLISLREMYEEQHEVRNLYKGGADKKLRFVEWGLENEAEFQQYYILRQSRSDAVMGVLTGLQQHVRQSDAVQRALRISNTFSGDFCDYAAFFNEVKKAPYLVACLMYRLFVRVRSEALTIIDKTFGSGRQHHGMLVAELVDLLVFDSEEEAVAFCQWRGAELGRSSDGQLTILSRSIDGKKPDPGELQVRRSMRVIESKVEHLTFSNIVRGGRVGIQLLERIVQFEVVAPGEAGNVFAAGKSAERPSTDFISPPSSSDTPIFGNASKAFTPSSRIDVTSLAGTPAYQQIEGENSQEAVRRAREDRKQLELQQEAEREEKERQEALLRQKAEDEAKARAHAEAMARAEAAAKEEEKRRAEERRKAEEKARVEEQRRLAALAKAKAEAEARARAAAEIRRKAEAEARTAAVDRIRHQQEAVAAAAQKKAQEREREANKRIAGVLQRLVDVEFGQNAPLVLRKKLEGIAEKQNLDEACTMYAAMYKTIENESCEVLKRCLDEIKTVEERPELVTEVQEKISGIAKELSKVLQELTRRIRTGKREILRQASLCEAFDRAATIISKTGPRPRDLHGCPVDDINSDEPQWLVQKSVKPVACASNSDENNQAVLSRLLEDIVQHQIIRWKVALVEGDELAGRCFRKVLGEPLEVDSQGGSTMLCKPEKSSIPRGWVGFTSEIRGAPIDLTATNAAIIMLTMEKGEIQEPNAVERIHTSLKRIAKNSGDGKRTGLPLVVLVHHVSFSQKQKGKSHREELETLLNLELLRSTGIVAEWSIVEVFYSGPTEQGSRKCLDSLRWLMKSSAASSQNLKLVCIGDHVLENVQAQIIAEVARTVQTPGTSIPWRAILTRVNTSLKELSDWVRLQADGWPNDFGTVRRNYMMCANAISKLQFSNDSGALTATAWIRNISRSLFGASAVADDAMYDTIDKFSHVLSKLISHYLAKKLGSLYGYGIWIPTNTELSGGLNLRSRLKNLKRVGVNRTLSSKSHLHPLSSNKGILDKQRGRRKGSSYRDALMSGTVSKSSITGRKRKLQTGLGGMQNGNYYTQRMLGGSRSELRPAKVCKTLEFSPPYGTGQEKAGTAEDLGHVVLQLDDILDEHHRHERSRIVWIQGLFASV